MTLEIPGILSCSLETCRCNAFPFVASALSAIAMVFPKTGIIMEE
jgi:hypothetical protein